MKMRESGLPFDDIRNLLADLPQADERMRDHTRAQSLHSGRNADVCAWYSAWSGRSPDIQRPMIALFAGTHAADRSAESWMLDQIVAVSSGEAVLNKVCQSQDIGLKVLDLALQIPVGDITVEAALDEKACAGTIAFGMEAIAGGTDLFGLAAVETGFNPSSLALVCILSELDPETVANAFPAPDPDQLIAKTRAAVGRGLRYRGDPLELLRQVGGRETAAICGAMMSARIEHVPVVLAGPSALASALVLARLNTGAVAHCMLASAMGHDALNSLAGEIGLLPVLPVELSQKDPVIDLAAASAVVKLAGLTHPVL